MTIRRRFACGLTVSAALLWSLAGTITSAAAATYTSLPAHVYAPYYETYLAPNTPSLTSTAQSSGAKYFTLAFLQSTGKSSCSLDWNGNAAQPLNYYAADIAALRATGGDVIPSFGGFSADQGAPRSMLLCLSRGLDTSCRPRLWGLGDGALAGIADKTGKGRSGWRASSYEVTPSRIR
jgi:hypothetical protein